MQMLKFQTQMYPKPENLWLLIAAISKPIAAKHNVEGCNQSCHEKSDLIWNPGLR